MKAVTDIRAEFLGFFKDKGHEIVDSSPLVPQNDPTLMFANSGMVQFKNLFTGTEKRPYTRATTAQKCVRAGGKHNDLENVGYTARHHTFFEMMGNFSFGDYFKEEAISYAWELVSKNFAMPTDKLLVTVHTSDEEAASLWRKIAGFSDDRIIRIPTDDNFWMMGDTGPCGPCSEIFFDQGDKLAGGPPGSPDQDGDRFLEFWNLVFMQFEQEPDGQGGYNRKPLPKPSIDTGMGLERTAALLQGKTSNYDIDLLRDIIEHSAALTGVSPDGKDAASHRVIADHLRAASFLIADGVLPSNEGRGYVLRRIMRRGMRHAHLLGAKEPLMYRLFPTLQNSMSQAYPELNRAQALITETLKLEEERFKRTLENGLRILAEESGKIQNKILPGEIAFKLYDTFGFPLDLTQDALKAEGISVDTAGFEKAMEEQKALARKSWSGAGGAATEKLWFEILDEIGPTEFLGYETENAEGKVLAIVKEGQRTDALEVGEEGIIITNQTPFYAESGGQVGDRGTIRTMDSPVDLFVQDTKKYASKIFGHHVWENDSDKEIRVGDNLIMIVDHARRAAIQSNHSATHLLHEALRRVLGEHVSQKGSLQDAERTRFDISHQKQISADELKKIEAIVNEEIRADTPVETRVMPLEEARESGAMALFGEKYDDEVRVVSMGRYNSPSHGEGVGGGVKVQNSGTVNPHLNPPPQGGGNKRFSVELCGGTHVKRTGDIGRLKIISEGSLSSGVRRVEAVTGARADAYETDKAQAFEQAQDRLKAENEKLRAELKALGGDLPADREDLERQNKKLQKEISDLRRKQFTEGTVQSGADIKTISGMKFTGRVLAGLPAKDLKPMADDLKKKLGSGVIVLVATEEGKASIVVGVTDDLTKRISAVDLVKIGAAALGGTGGGGRPDMAQAGGPDAASANDAVAAVERALS
ncbi:MAG: alanine--tRNA ligase [Alphaproteobacteria bacterium]|nr:alanine--tRNA ligase [Alphaproteobacteria bacterium]